MSRILPAFLLAILLALASGGAASAQTATPKPTAGTVAPSPTPTAPADYEAQALEQLGNLRNIAAAHHWFSGVPTDTASSAIALLADEFYPFVSNVTPPAEFAPFHMSLFMALRPCQAAAALHERGGGSRDAYTAVVTATYAQSCYTAAADASVEWARVTGRVPIFYSTATPTATPAAALPSDDGPRGTLSQTVEGVTVDILSLEVSDFGSFSEANTQLAGRLADQSDFTPAAVGVLSVGVTNRTAASTDVIPVQFAAIVVAGEQIDLSAYRLLSTNDLDTTYYPGASKSGTIYFALPQSAWDAIKGGAQVGYYIGSYDRDYAFEIAPTLP
jgi:hypothetical protein